MTEEQALDAIFAAYGVGVGRVARRLRSASAGATLQLAEDLPEAAGLLDQVLTGLGAAVAREDGPAGEVRLSGTVGSGWFDMNPTLVAAVVRPGPDGGAAVSVRAVAKEGLVPQRSAARLVERLQRALTTPAGPGRRTRGGRQ